MSWTYAGLILIVILVWGCVILLDSYLTYKMRQECDKINMTYGYHDTRSFYCYRMTSHGIIYQEIIYQSYASDNRSPDR